MQTFDVAVVGLGAVGGATAYQLARQNARVLGIDRHAPPHALASSHGGTRITREAIGEGEHLTPLARRSHQLWREIEVQTGASLLSTSGVLIISSPNKTSFTHVENFFENTIATARKHGIAHEVLDADAIRERYPQFRVHDEELGYFEPGAGFVRPEACIAAQLNLARRYGADIHISEHVKAFATTADEVLLTTEANEYRAKKVVLAPGAWLPDFLGTGVSGLFRVYRQMMFWFAGRDDFFKPNRFPVFIWELSGPTQAIYGFPDVDGRGVKVATEQYDIATMPGASDRHVLPEEAAAMHRNLIAPFLPRLSADCVSAAACLYTVTPDFGFVIDHHPQSERIILASCCSGHGFKHSAAIGEVLAAWALTGQSPIDLTPFRLKRFRST
jgi:sarcosine oxidase